MTRPTAEGGSDGTGMGAHRNGLHNWGVRAPNRGVVGLLEVDVDTPADVDGRPRASTRRMMGRGAGVGLCGAICRMQERCLRCMRWTGDGRAGGGLYAVEAGGEGREAMRWASRGG